MAGVGTDSCPVVDPVGSFVTCRGDVPLPRSAIATRIVRCPLPSPPPVAPLVRDAPLRAGQVEAPHEDPPLVGDHRPLGRARLLNAVAPARRRRVRELECHVTARNVESNDPRARDVRRRVPLVSAKSVSIVPLVASSETSVVRVLPPRGGPPHVRVDEVNVRRPATESRVPTTATLEQVLALREVRAVPTVRRAPNHALSALDRGHATATRVPTSVMLAQARRPLVVSLAVGLAVSLVDRGAIRTRAAKEEVADLSLRARVAIPVPGRVEHLVSSAPRRSRRSVRTPTDERRVGEVSLERGA